MGKMNKVGKTATKITERDGMTHVRYHNTDVVSFNEHKVILRTDGWKTVTTKARMNQTANEFNLPYNVYQVKGEWKVSVLDTVIPFTGDTLEIKIR